MKILLGCFRTAEAGDAEVYTAGLVAVMSNYPASVLRKVVDPRVGLPSTSQWLPTLAEVRKACDAEHTRQLTEARYAAMGRPQPSRRLGSADPANVFVPPHAPQYEAVRAKCTEQTRAFWHLDESREGVWVPLEWVLVMSPQSKIFGPHSPERQQPYRG